MDETPQEPTVSEALPEALPARPSRWWRPSLVWLVPALAGIIALWVGIRALTEKGPTITISFKNAEGLEVGKTTIKYRSVDVGVISAIDLSKDASGVIVTAQLSRKAKPLLVEDTVFWVVRPRVALAGISGLQTILTGPHIAMDAGKSEVERDSFLGLENPPAITADKPGRQFVLKAQDMGSLDVGSPIYFRRASVGQVVSASLDRTGVTFGIFVNAPYDEYVTNNVRFWHASGVDLTVDAAGVRLDSQSLASIIVGGIAFELPPRQAPGPLAAPMHTFTLFSGREAALRRPDTRTDTYVLVFNKSVRGLSPGASVDFLGLNMGEVTDISLDFDPKKGDFQAIVEIDLHPDRLRARAPVNLESEADTRSLIERLIARGLRAQLRSGNLLTGQLYVAFDFFPGTPPVALDVSRKPLQLPTVPGGLDELQGSVVRILNKLEKIPTDKLGDEVVGAARELREVLNGSKRLVGKLESEVSGEGNGLFAEARKALGSAQQVLSSDAPVQRDLRDALSDLSRAARSLRALTDFLERHPEAILQGKAADKR
jgi:paraquat-inducible protein B